jgi:hypothetical protein
MLELTPEHISMSKVGEVWVGGEENEVSASSRKMVVDSTSIISDWGIATHGVVVPGWK